MGLKITDLQFGYKDKIVLDDINFSVKNGELLSILGPNGVGKTTLLKCINKINKPNSGQIMVDGKDISNFNEKSLAHHLSYVPQSTHSSFPISVIDTVIMGRIPFMKLAVNDRDKKIAFDILEMMNLADLAFKQINQLSGGERQRVFIARAIAQEPKVLLLDEPTSSLDMKHQLETMGLIRKIIKEKNIAVVMSIHDLNIALMFSDKAVMIKEGRVYSFGNCNEVITPENIKVVYGVNTMTTEIDGNRAVILMNKM